THDALRAAHVVDISARGGRQDDRRSVRLIGDKHVGAQGPVVVHGVAGCVYTQGHGIAEAEGLVYAKFIDRADDLLLHVPNLLRDYALRGIHWQIVDEGGLYHGRRQDGRQAQTGNVVRQRLGIAIVDHRLRGDEPAVKNEVVTDRPAAVERFLELRAQVAQLSAPTVADIVVLEAVTRRIRYLEILELLAVIGGVELIEAGIRTDRAVGKDIRKVGDPLIVVVQCSSPEHDRAVVESML